MADSRSRHAGRKSPTFNPARASMPVNIGYNLPYTGELHAVPAARYDPSVPRRHDSKTASGSNTPATTVTTYNVTKDPLSRSLSRSNRNRSSTVDAHAGKPPIIVTTNHPRPHVSSSHASSSARPVSPSRETYRPSDSTYYAVQPASSMRSRSHNRHSSYTYTHGAPLGDELHRLRERVRGPEGARAIGETEFWAPSRTSTDNFRNPRPHLYAISAHPARPTHATHTAAPAYGNTSAIADYDDDYYEYTKPSELVKYDLDHDRDRRGRRDSVDRPYYRPHVNVLSHDTTRYDPRTRGKPPTAAGLERYNRGAAAGTYDRPSVTMPAPPAVPPPPPIDPSRRPLLEAPRSPSSETRNARPRPVSLYQDGPTRSLHVDDLYRSRDDERVGKDRRDRDDPYRDDNVTSRGFGIRTDTLDQSGARLTSTLPAQTYDERHSRHEPAERESRHGSDESLTRTRAHDRDAHDSHRSRVEDSRDRKDSLNRRESVSRTRDKVAAGLKGAAAAVGLMPVIGRDDTNVSPKRRARDEEKEYNPRVRESSRPRERESAERISSRDDSIAYEERREPRRDRSESVSDSKDREQGRERERERERDHERDHDHDRDREYVDERAREREYVEERHRERARERERERDREDERDQRERQQHDTEAKLNGSTSDKTQPSPDDASNIGRRRQRPSSPFDPTDTKGLMDLKAELAALDHKNKEVEKADEVDVPSTRETASTKTAPGANGSDRGDESSTESRGREIVPAREEKQVRVVSPPREKAEQKPIKGILKAPSVRFPEDSNPIREGVAPHKDDKTKKDVPAGARWTKISRKKVNPQALTIGKERFEVRDDFVIVLRVLNKDEIQAYATATAVIRERRRNEVAKDGKTEYRSDEEQTRSDEERQRRHRHRQEREEEEVRRGRTEDDRHSRHKYDDGSESRPKTIEYQSGPGHHHRQYDS